MPFVILASGSPRRAAILHNLGIDPEIRPTDIDEAVEPGESASTLVERLARAKFEACSQLVVRSPQPVLVVAADTVVAIGGSILGKPEGKADAERMLTTLSGTEHRVVTGMTAGLIDPGTGGDTLDPVFAHETTDVTFRSLDQDLIDWYVGTGEAFDKAGSYGIQGQGALLVEGIKGSYLNVVGLPVVALDKLCRRLGWPLHRLAQRSTNRMAPATEAGIGV